MVQAVREVLEKLPILIDQTVSYDLKDKALDALKHLCSSLFNVRLCMVHPPFGLSGSPIRRFLVIALFKRLEEGTGCS